MSQIMTEVTRWGDVMARGGARRQEIRRRHENGLDTVEVDRDGHRLQLTFLEHAPADVQPGNIRVDGPGGATAVRAVAVRRAAADDPHLEDRLLVELAAPGGAGRYTLRLVEPMADGRPGWAPLRGLDPRFAQAEFSFDVDLPNPVAGAAGAVPAPAGLQASYLARDYEGLRQLILDRLAQTMPAWTERHVPDLGITLVELLAYVGDDLSYYQDAVATEGYLQTARRRISVRRHARLVDYRLAEGSQARAWVCLAVTEAVELPLREVVFAVAPGVPPGRSPVLPLAELLPGAAAPARPYTPVRAALGPPGPTSGDSRGRGPTISASPAHNEVGLWAWGEPDCWLRAGATTAVLADSWTDPDDHGPAGPRSLTLQAGDVAVLEATRDPSGIGPPDPTRRHPVRLTAVRPAVDRLYDQAVLEVSWAPEAALPFDLQISAPGLGGRAVPCAVARCNTVLVGDGAAVTEQLPAGPLTPPTPLTLTHPALTWACPYPDPAIVARHQSRLLGELPERWRREVDGWRRDAESGQALDEHRLTRLRDLLGEDALTELGLGGGPRDRNQHDAAGLRRLLLDAGRLLAPRLRRLAVLAALARASGPLDEVLLREVADDWGDDLASLLSAHHPAAWGTAGAATSQDAGQALPLLRLAPAAGTAGGQLPWTMVADVVDSPPGSRRAMVEVDDAGLGHLRFSPGDQPAGPVLATYQVGQGSAGNVPARAINAVAALTPGAAAALAAVQSLGNPLPATGGTDPEGVTAARAALPGAFLVDQPRALTAADYTTIAERVPGVRRAATVLRWTGTRYAADVAVQPAVGEDPGQQLLAAVDDALWPVRRIGHELWVRAPGYRPLVLGLSVDLGAAAVRADVSAALTALLSSGSQADGTPGLFSPQRLGFGQPVYASPIVAAAQDVPGVEAVVLSRFGFLGPPGAGRAGAGPAGPGRLPGLLRLRPGEIARLDNDPEAPEHGYAVLNLRGGR